MIAGADTWAAAPSRRTSAFRPSCRIKVARDPLAHSRPETWYPLVVGMTKEGWARWTGGTAMSADLLSALHPGRIARNKGRIIGQKRPLLPRHVWSIRDRLELAGNARDLALFNMAIESKLRGCDLVAIRVRDVFTAGQVKERTSMIQSKTGKPVRFEITRQRDCRSSAGSATQRCSASSSCGPANSTAARTCRRASMPGSSEAGWCR